MNKPMTRRKLILTILVIIILLVILKSLYSLPNMIFAGLLLTAHIPFRQQLHDFLNQLLPLPKGDPLSVIGQDIKLDPENPIRMVTANSIPPAPIRSNYDFDFTVPGFNHDQCERLLAILSLTAILAGSSLRATFPTEFPNFRFTVTNFTHEQCQDFLDAAINIVAAVGGQNVAGDTGGGFVPASLDSSSHK